MSVAEGKTVREGSAQKRTSILDAARDLFLADGFDRTSVDAVSARAGVSKRTVYDYYGDKRALFLAVFEDVAAKTMQRLRDALAETLVGVTAAAELEDALIRFCARVSITTLGSNEYMGLMRLTSLESVNLPDLSTHWMATEPEDAIAELFEKWVRLGLLDAPNPRIAADHFVALVFSEAYAHQSAWSDPLSDEAARATIAVGVRAFLRAYATARPAW